MNQQPFKKAGTTEETANAFGLNIGTLANLRSKKRGPKYYKRGRKIFYFFDDVETWLKENPVLTLDSIE